MRTLAVFILALASALPAFAEWETYKPKDDQFTISFPGRLSAESETPTAFGTTLHTATYKSEGDLFSVTYGEPGMKSIPTEAEKAEFFKGVRGSAQGKGSLLSESEVTLGGHPGKEFFVKTNGQGFMRMQAYLVNTRMYSLLVASIQEADLKSEAANHFLTSFAFPQGVPPVLPATPVQSQAIPPRKSVAEVIGGAVGTILIVLLLMKLRHKKTTEPK